jgi:hypothetical protein
MTTLEILQSEGYALISVCSMEDGRYEIVLAKDDKK